MLMKYDDNIIEMMVYMMIMIMYIHDHIDDSFGWYKMIMVLLQCISTQPLHPKLNVTQGHFYRSKAGLNP